MTLNLRYENKWDVGKRSWAERILGIVRMVRSESPDFLGIQEGQHGQVADLRASLSDYDFRGLGRDDGIRKGEYTGIFFRRDRFELDEGKSGMIWLSATPKKPGSMTWGNSFPRIATWVRLTDRSSAKTVWVVNVHLDHQSQESREKGVALMAGELTRMNLDDEAVIWLGDFNATADNEAVQFLQGKKSSIARVSGYDGLQETFSTANPGATPKGSLHFWMSDPKRQWKVDHIFVSKWAEVLEARVITSGEPYLSDHFPVMAKVRF